MIRRPEIYISAASDDLSIAVNLVRSEVLQMGATPVHVDHYPAEWAASWTLMEHHISKCDAVIHIAGACFGAEPVNRPAAEPRRSYAQLEYAMSRSLGKTVFAFVCGAEFPYLSHPSEQEDLQTLQRAHQDRLIRHNGEKIRVPGAEDLRTSVRQLQETLGKMMSDFAERDRLIAASSPPQRESSIGKASSILAGVDSINPPAANSRPRRPWYPPRAAPDHVGRIQEKEYIIEALKASRKVAIVGPRGIGKTALAAAALTEIAPGPDGPGAFPGGVLSYNFHHSPGYYAALAGILMQAGLADVPDTKHEAAVRQLLARPDICLFLEGCEKAEALDRLLQLVGKASVILEAVDHFPVPGFQTVQVHQLPLEDAAFLLYRARVVIGAAEQDLPGSQGPPIPSLQDQVWQKLAYRLGAHPLLLHLAALRLRADGCTPGNLLATMETGGIDSFELLASEQGSVAWILAGSAQELARKDPRTLPAWYAMALHAHSPVPQKSLAAALGIPESEVEAHLHLLVHRCYVREHLVQGEQPGTMEKAWTLESVALAESARLQWEWRDPIQQNPLFDPRAIYSRWRDWGLIYLRECWKTRTILGGVERYRFLEPHLHALLAGIERNEGSTSPNLLAALRWLSSLHRLMGRFASAHPLSERLHALSQSLYGPEHPETLSSINNLATLHYRKGDLAAAEPLYRQSLMLREKILGKDHPDTLSSQNNMANVLADKSDLKGAEELYRASLEGRQRVLGPEHQDTLVSAKNLANLLLDKGQFSAAEPLFRSTLEAQIRVLGGDHPDAAMTAYNYARLCVQLRRIPEAITLAQHAVDTARKNFPEGHPHRQKYEQLLSRLSPDAAWQN